VGGGPPAQGSPQPRGSSRLEGVGRWRAVGPSRRAPHSRGRGRTGPLEGEREGECDGDTLRGMSAGSVVWVPMLRVHACSLGEGGLGLCPPSAARARAAAALSGGPAAARRGGSSSKARIPRGAAHFGAIRRLEHVVSHEIGQLRVTLGLQSLFVLCFALPPLLSLLRAGTLVGGPDGLGLLSWVGVGHRSVWAGGGGVPPLWPPLCRPRDVGPVSWCPRCAPSLVWPAGLARRRAWGPSVAQRGGPCAKRVSPWPAAARSPAATAARPFACTPTARGHPSAGPFAKRDRGSTSGTPAP
jgi:hypothetical protein